MAVRVATYCKCGVSGLFMFQFYERKDSKAVIYKEVSGRADHLKIMVVIFCMFSNLGWFLKFISHMSDMVAIIIILKCPNIMKKVPYNSQILSDQEAHRY